MPKWKPCPKSRMREIAPAQGYGQFDINTCGRKTDARTANQWGRVSNAQGIAMRPTTLLFCLALAGCAGGNAAPEVTGSTPAPSAARPHSPLARAAQASGKKDDWWKEGGITREKINAMCWMKYETGRKDVQIDKRADLVNDCVKQTLKEHPIR